MRRFFRRSSTKKKEESKEKEEVDTKESDDGYPATNVSQETPEKRNTKAKDEASSSPNAKSTPPVTKSKTHENVTPQRQESSELDWLFDYMSSVFKSPGWDVPVMTFIDEKCVVFDNEEENKLSYMEIHKEFKDLVENLLTQHLSVVGASEEMFFAACKAAHDAQVQDEVIAGVFSQLIAVDDFVTFKRLMLKRNMDLEYEAVLAMQRDEGAGSPIRAPKNKQEEDAQYEEAIRLSKESMMWEVETSKQQKEQAKLQLEMQIGLQLEKAQIQEVQETIEQVVEESNLSASEELGRATSNETQKAYDESKNATVEEDHSDEEEQEKERTMIAHDKTSSSTESKNNDSESKTMERQETNDDDIAEGKMSYDEQVKEKVASEQEQVRTPIGKTEKKTTRRHAPLSESKYSESKEGKEGDNNDSVGGDESKTASPMKSKTQSYQNPLDDLKANPLGGKKSTPLSTTGSLPPVQPRNLGSISLKPLDHSKLSPLVPSTHSKLKLGKASLVDLQRQKREMEKKHQINKKDVENEINRAKEALQHLKVEKSKNVNDLERLKREKYLKRQRELLLEKKNRQRQAELAKYQQEQKRKGINVKTSLDVGHKLVSSYSSSSSEAKAGDGDNDLNTKKPDWLTGKSEYDKLKDQHAKMERVFQDRVQEYTTNIQKNALSVALAKRVRMQVHVDQEKLRKAVKERETMFSTLEDQIENSKFRREMLRQKEEQLLARQREINKNGDKY
eukprot:g307.t1